MRILVDVNLPPTWVETREAAGFEGVHWRDVGAMNAPDVAIMQWARDHQAIVFTHDLDFSALLAATGALGPSVVQVRTQDVTPAAISTVVIAALKQHHAALLQGALVTIDLLATRVRILPIRREG
jgi:predicted nuclease of predicted toxin-antitoxin system